MFIASNYQGLKLSKLQVGLKNFKPYLDVDGKSFLDGLPKREYDFCRLAYPPTLIAANKAKTNVNCSLRVWTPGRNYLKKY